MGRPKGSKNKPKTETPEKPKKGKRMEAAVVEAPKVQSEPPKNETPKDETPKAEIKRPVKDQHQANPEFAKKSPEEEAAIAVYSKQVSEAMARFSREVAPEDPDLIGKWMSYVPGMPSTDW